MRDKAFEEAVLNICDKYGIAIARCALCGRLPKIDFRWTGGPRSRNNKVEAYCTGGRFFGKHTRVSVVVVNAKGVENAFCTDVVGMWNELNMKSGYVKPQEMPGRTWDDD